jgi:hypothetical protein
VSALPARQPRCPEILQGMRCPPRCCLLGLWYLESTYDSLIEIIPTARLLLLVNYRPEYQHGWGSKTFYTQLRADPLTSESADVLLQASSMRGSRPTRRPPKRPCVSRSASTRTSSICPGPS